MWLYGADTVKSGPSMLKLIRDRKLKERARQLAEQQQLEQANTALHQRLVAMLGEAPEIKQAA